jgi:hypothetical protein
MVALNYEYVENGSAIAIRANLKEGFDLRQNAYVFDRHLPNIPFKEGTKFACHFFLKNLDDNQRFAHFLENEFHLITWTENIELVQCTISQGVFEARVKLNRRNFSLANAESKNPSIRIKENITPTRPTRSPAFLLERLKNPKLVSGYAGFSLQPRFFFNFHLSIRDDSQCVFPLEYEAFEDKRVVSGGRPESDRSKF